MKLRLLFFAIFSVFTLSVAAQEEVYSENTLIPEPIFTQNTMVLEALNPAFTGHLQTINLGVFHRTQAPDLNTRTDSDYAFFNTSSQDNKRGFGINAFSHRDKFMNYKLTVANMKYSYTVQLDDVWSFRTGIELGFGTKSFGAPNYASQVPVNNGTIDLPPPTPSIDYSGLDANNRITFFDFTTGVALTTANGWVGLSMKHLNRPEIQFTTKGAEPLDLFYTTNAGYQFYISDYFDTLLLPVDAKMLLTTNYMKQANYNRLDVGSSLLFNKIAVGFSLSSSPTIYGSNSHVLNSINIIGGVAFEHFNFGYAYDFNTSSAQRTLGTFEISVTYQFDFKIRCFGCPTSTE